MGVSTPLEIEVQAPGAHVEDLRVVLKQNGKQFPLFTLADQKGAEVRQNGADRLVVTREVGKQAVPELQSGSAAIVVTAARKVLYGIRTVESTARRDFKVRLERPRVSVASTHHYVNHGGAEMVVYRATPKTSRQACWWGMSSTGIPASGAALEGVKIADPALRVAFFALLHDQDLKTPIRLFARDEAGNTARADFDYRVFPKPFKRSRIDVDRPAARSRRSGDPRRNDGGEAGGRQPGEVPRDQRRAATEEQREDRIDGRADQARAALAGRRLSSVLQYRGGVGVRRSSHLHLQGQGSRSAGAPRLRPGLVCGHTDRLGKPRDRRVRRRTGHLR